MCAKIKERNNKKVDRMRLSPFTRLPGWRNMCTKSEENEKNIFVSSENSKNKKNLEVISKEEDGKVSYWFII